MKREEKGLAQLTRKNTALLKSGRMASLGPIETIRLRTRGRSDGSRGIPCPGRDGAWLSPLMRQEQDRFAEFSDRTWGKLQIAASEPYAQMAQICDRIRAAERELEEQRNADSNRQTASYTRRKLGEEALSDSQIQARRQREDDKSRAPRLAQIQSLEQTVITLRLQLSKIYHEIEEANHVTMLICERVMNHSLQRMDVYWNSAYAKHPKAAQMPVIPEITLTPMAEETYFAQHETLLQAAEEILRAGEDAPLSADSKEEEAA